MSDDADVVELFPAAEQIDHEQPIRSRPKDWSKPSCSHRRTELDHDKHRVYCSDCGEERDAFSVLATFAADPDNYIRRRKEAARRMREVEDRLAELLQRERNAKARVRKWGARSGEAAERALADVLAQCAHAGTDPKVKRFAEHVAWYARRGVRG